MLCANLYTDLYIIYWTKSTCVVDVDVYRYICISRDMFELWYPITSPYLRALLSILPIKLWPSKPATLLWIVETEGLVDLDELKGSWRILKRSQNHSWNKVMDLIPECFFALLCRGMVKDLMFLRDSPFVWVVLHAADFFFGFGEGEWDIGNGILTSQIEHPKYVPSLKRT